MGQFTLKAPDEFIKEVKFLAIRKNMSASQILQEAFELYKKSEASVKTKK